MVVVETQMHGLHANYRKRIRKQGNYGSVSVDFLDPPASPKSSESNRQ